MKLYSIVAIPMLVVMVAGTINKASAAEKEKATATAIYKVEEIYAKKDNLKGKKVTVRGEVVKFNERIMGKNWLHIRDGSGKQGTNDLTATTNDTAKVGDKVTVTGVLSVDKDFGGGYKYQIILEEATVNVKK